MKRIAVTIGPFSLCFLLIISTLLCSGQQDKKVSLSATGHFNFGLNQFESIDDAGFGISVKALYVSAKKTRKGGLGAETSADWFLGQKLYFENGRNNKPAIYSLRIGPHLFLSKRIQVNAMYGVVRYVLRETDFMTAGSYKLGANMMLGKKEKLSVGFFHVGVQRSPKNLTYFGISLGYIIN